MGRVCFAYTALPYLTPDRSLDFDTYAAHRAEWRAAAAALFCVGKVKAKRELLKACFRLSALCGGAVTLLSAVGRAGHGCGCAQKCRGENDL